MTGRLLELVRLGYADAGFPVLTKELTVDRDGRTYACLRVVGFLGINELEHALTELQDEPDAVLNLAPDDLQSSRMSIFSFNESHEGRSNPYDLSQYLDRVSRIFQTHTDTQAPITVQVHSPLELVQQMFVKLGARQILVTDARGTYRGALYKKQWIAFLDDLEHERLEWHGVRLYHS
jgi:chloride channel 3/4/5